MLREIGAIANGGRTRLLTEGITGGAHGGPSGALGSAADAEATTTIHPLEIANNVVSAGALYDAREEEDQARSISHWSPYDRVRVVNAEP